MYVRRQMYVQGMKEYEPGGGSYTVVWEGVQLCTQGGWTSGNG